MERGGRGGGVVRVRVLPCQRVRDGVRVRWVG